MKKFIVIFHASAAAMEQMGQMGSASPEEQQKAMQPWVDWADRNGSALLDQGSPIMGGLKLSKSGSTPSNQSVAGYSIVQAEDLEAAKALLQGHPHLDWAPGCEIEVYESMHGPV
ncbi:MAG: hypothetical protein O2812_03055 [Chloroflexi bacterium]|nr:hypothetical protein [Chloroflexota bacterium]